MALRAATLPFEAMMPRCSLRQSRSESDGKAARVGDGIIPPAQAPFYHGNRSGSESEVEENVERKLCCLTLKHDSTIKIPQTVKYCWVCVHTYVQVCIVCTNICTYIYKHLLYTSCGYICIVVSSDGLVSKGCVKWYIFAAGSY